MKIGPLEIILIIAVIIALTVIARIIGSGRDKAAREGNSSSGNSRQQPWLFLNRTGIVLVIAGGLALIIAATLFRLILQSYLWALLVIAIGFILVRISRRKRVKY